MSEGQGRKKGKEEILEVISENFPKLMTGTQPQIQKLKKLPTKSVPGHILLKLLKN